MRNPYLAMFVHLIWGTWDRLPLISARLRPAVYRSIGQACVKLGARVIALNGVEDHVHLLIEMPATVPIAHIVKDAKGQSSWLVTHRLEPDGFFKWQGAYGAISVDPTSLDRVAHYMAEQQHHHACQNLIDAWEKIPDSGRTALASE